MAVLGTVRASIFKFVEAFFLPENVLSSRQKWVLGLINLGSVVFFWVMSSFLVNDLVEDGSYRKPFFITYVNTGLFCLYLIPYLRYEHKTIAEFIEQLKQEYYSQKSRKFAGLLPVPETPLSPNSDGDNYGTNGDIEANLQIVDQQLLAPDRVGVYETVKLSFQFLMLWFTANLVTNASLSYTSVASQTILSSTSSFFTLIVGYLYSVEKINSNKIVGILLSFTGVFIVTKIDSSKTSSSASANINTVVLFGNLLALSGALVYGIYTILLKFKITIPHTNKERVLNTHLFFGFVGIFCLISLLPVLILLHFTGYETFEFPPTKKVLGVLLTNAFITLISDFCWCKAVLLTSPLTVTVGLSMTIPLAMVGDWVFKQFAINWGYLFGACIVTAGFLIINRDEETDFVSQDD